MNFIRRLDKKLCYIDVHGLDGSNPWVLTYGQAGRVGGPAGPVG